MDSVSGGGRHQLHWSLLPCRALQIITVQVETLFRSLRWQKVFLRHFPRTHTSLYSMLGLDSTVPLHEWWTVFMVCSMCANRQRCLLFCLFVADRARVLLAVRPSIHKAVLSLIDGDPLNYRLEKGRQHEKKKVSYKPLIFQHCVFVNKEKREWMSRRSQMHFSLFHFLFSSGCHSLVRPCLVLLLSRGVITV